MYIVKDVCLDHMSHVLTHNHTIIDFKIQTCCGGTFFISSLSTGWCDPPHTFLIISVGDRLIRLSLNGFKCSRPISALL